MKANVPWDSQDHNNKMPMILWKRSIIFGTKPDSNSPAKSLDW